MLALCTWKPGGVTQDGDSRPEEPPLVLEGEREVETRGHVRAIRAELERAEGEVERETAIV